MGQASEPRRAYLTHLSHGSTMRRWQRNCLMAFSPAYDGLELEK